LNEFNNSKIQQFKDSGAMNAVVIVPKNKDELRFVNYEEAERVVVALPSNFPKPTE
jgi:hypothetical protein